MKIDLSLIVTGLALLAAGPAHGAGRRDVDGLVNINTATPEQLRLLPGVGPAKAANILAYRRAHPFRTVEELVRIKGIGHKMVRRLRLHLCVTGSTTAQAVMRPLSARTRPPPPVVSPHGPRAGRRPGS
jgi:competence protein ComEA